MIFNDGLGEDLLRLHECEAGKMLQEAGRLLFAEIHLHVLSVAQVSEEIPQEAPVFFLHRCR